MSQTVTRTLRCDFCGKTHDRSKTVDDAGHTSWFKIGTEMIDAAEVPWIGSSTFTATLTPPPRAPDLCSWQCVAGYAQRKAAELTAQAEAAR